MAAAQAEQKNDSGPTQAQVDCKNRAVNDYYDQLKECDKALGDLPADNAMCHSDARDDLSRRQAGCTAAAMTGGTRFNQDLQTGGVLAPETSGQPARGPQVFRPGGILQRR